MYARAFNSKKVAEQRQLKTDILAAKAELLQTSSQDQFAKWAKLRRRHDKALEEFEEMSKCTIKMCLFDILVMTIMG